MRHVAALLLPVLLLFGSPGPAAPRPVRCPNLVPIARSVWSPGKMRFSIESLVPGQCTVMGGQCVPLFRQVVVLQVSTPVEQLPGSYLAVCRDCDVPGQIDPGRMQIVSGPTGDGEAAGATLLEYVTPGKTLVLAYYESLGGQLVLSGLACWTGQACQ